MILLTATDISRQFQVEPVFQHLDLEIQSGQRIGLVGPNGTGKTTLMRILAGLDQPDSGKVQRRPDVRISLLRQEPDFAPDRTLYQEAESALGPLLALQRQLVETSERMAHAEDERARKQLENRYDQLHEQLKFLDAYTLEHRIEEVLDGLGFRREDYNRAVATFSGGQQSRLMLAKLLLEAPDLMLLDEPSNHLDIDATTWLENYLSRQEQAMLIVSHDRYFLDRVVNRIVELSGGRVELYSGNYAAYWKQKAERVERQRKLFERQQEYIAAQEDYIRRYGAGQRATQAHDREKKLARIERIEKPHDVSGPVFGFGAADRSGDIVLEAQDLGKGYDRPLFEHLDLQVLRGQRLGIMGPNGGGKSTLLKVLIGIEPPSSGRARLGQRVRVGYYDQALASLPVERSVLQAAWPDDAPDATEGETRSHLARFGLTGEMVFRNVSDLSGGEKSRLALARLVAAEPNLLVLDEPTNHLDVWACEALERSILEFEGTVLVVSHDRYFLNKIAQRLVVIRAGKARIVEGNYDTYQDLLEREAAARAAEAARTAARNGGKASSSNNSPAKPARKWRFPFRRPDDLEAEIHREEERFHAIEAQLALPDTWRDGERARQIQKDYDELKTRIATLYAHWEEALERNS